MKNDYWVLDFIIAFYATSNTSYFIEYEKGDFGNTQLGNNETYKIFSIGKIKIELLMEINECSRM